MDQTDLRILRILQEDSSLAVSDVATVVSRHKQVIHIFAGHMHRPWTAMLGGVAASTVPSVATDLRYGSYLPTNATQPVYQIHRFDGDDSFVIEPRLPGSGVGYPNT